METTPQVCPERIMGMHHAILAELAEGQKATNRNIEKLATNTMENLNKLATTIHDYIREDKEEQNRRLMQLEQDHKEITKAYLEQAGIITSINAKVNRSDKYWDRLLWGGGIGAFLACAKLFWDIVTTPLIKKVIVWILEQTVKA